MFTVIQLFLSVKLNLNIKVSELLWTSSLSAVFKNSFRLFTLEYVSFVAANPLLLRVGLETSH